jgi:ATP-binding cassette, subfamily C, bacterial
VLLLLPLLQLAGVDLQTGAVERVASQLRAGFALVRLTPTLPVILLSYVLVTTLLATLVRAQTLFDARLVQDYTQNLRKRLYEGIAHAEWLALTRIRSSDFTFALTTAADRVAGAAHQLLSVGATAAVAAIYIALALIVSPAMSGVVLAAAAFLLIAQRTRGLSARRSGEDLDESTSSLYATAAEQLGGLKTAKSYGNEERHLEIFLRNGENVNSAGYALARTYAALRWRQSVGAVLALSVILFLALRFFHLTTAALLLLLFLFSRLVPRLITVQQTLQYIEGALPALATIQGLIESCKRSIERVPGEQVPIAQGDITVRDLSFMYGGSDMPALAGVTLHIPIATTAAIVGSSGSGKTTLADVLLGLIKPDEGKVYIGSEPLDATHLASWRSQIGYVAQDTYLFNDSVRANLAWAQPDATESAMRESLQHAAASDFVDRLPNGIDTVIGERGVRLSGGEKQRLSLARALLRKPKLVVLDEATSALDSENEERIYKAIEELHGETTILIITHRLATVRAADRIHVMDRGRIVASGTWDALMSDSLRFRELAAAQGIETNS